MGFDSKCEFAPPTILLGLLLYLGHGVSPHSHFSAYLLTGVSLILNMVYLHRACPAPRSHSLLLHKSLIILYQRADRLKSTITEN